MLQKTKHDISTQNVLDNQEFHIKNAQAILDSQLLIKMIERQKDRHRFIKTEKSVTHRTLDTLSIMNVMNDLQICYSLHFNDNV